MAEVLLNRLNERRDAAEDPAAKRRRHRPTVCRLVPTVAAMDRFSWPSAASRIILARRAKRTGVRRPLAHCCNCVRSSSVT
jgi:hypothetical protein